MGMGFLNNFAAKKQQGNGNTGFGSGMNQGMGVAKPVTQPASAKPIGMAMGKVGASAPPMAKPMNNTQGKKSAQKQFGGGRKISMF